MANGQSRGHRESRKPQQELPEVPDLGRLSMPRRTNRRAARYVATIGPLWDRRRADRKARRNALLREDAQAASPRRRHLDKKVRERMLRTMTGWSFDHRQKAFVTPEVTSERVEELVDAIVELELEPVVLRVAGLGRKECARVRGYLSVEALLVPVHARFERPTFT